MHERIEDSCMLHKCNKHMQETAEKAQEDCRKAYNELAQVWRPGHETPCLPAGLQSHGSLGLTASHITTCRERKAKVKLFSDHNRSLLRQQPKDHHLQPHMTGFVVISCNGRRFTVLTVVSNCFLSVLLALYAGNMFCQTRELLFCASDAHVLTV